MKSQNPGPEDEVVPSLSQAEVTCCCEIIAVRLEDAFGCCGRARKVGAGVNSSSRCLANRRSRCTPSCPAISTGPLPSFPPLSLASLTSCSQIAQLQRCEPISEEEVKQLCLKAREILIEEGNVQVVDSPVTVRRVIAPVVHRGSMPVRYVATSTGNSGI